jgi:putative sugar O-methyltransferase
MSINHIKALVPTFLHPILRKFVFLMKKNEHGIQHDGRLMDWNLYLQDQRMDFRLKDMLNAYIADESDGNVSAYWQVLNQKNVAQLLDMGYENFKQTVALNYFTWLIGMDDPQVKFLMANLPGYFVRSAQKRAASLQKHHHFTSKQSTLYNFITCMLWEYTSREVKQTFINRLEEPSEGNPPLININGKNISQDLANSVLEVNSISDGIDLNHINTVMELGVGYGRTAYVLLKLFPHLRYIIVDIPPALYISERYLTSQFPDRKIFRFRKFNNFSEIAEEFYNAQIIFLMPNQLKLLPSKIIDLFIAIDCLHEMRLEQIHNYLAEIDRLASYIYLKCWKETKIPYDDITITEDDYPIPSSWNKVFRNDCKVQTTYFEALFEIQ